jgi:hypothetical protein
MGFLDHSTNNIIVDAVLTDYGRRVLADNQGRFRVKKFSLSDDEIDYTIIQKYGRSVGKEKLIKNTPIFEAQTRENLAMKYRMLTLNDPTVLYLPSLALRSNVSNGLVTMRRRGDSSLVQIDFEQTILLDSVEVPAGLADIQFTVILSDRFLRLDGESPISIDSGSRTAYYSVMRTGTTNKKGSKSRILLAVQPNLDNNVFSIYSVSDNKDKISTIVSIIGESSGIRTDFVVDIEKN